MTGTAVNVHELRDPRFFAPGPDIKNLTQIIPRKDWGALPPKEVTPIQHPTPYVLFTITETDPCFTQEECTKMVQNFQKEHMDAGMPDIRFNFLIGNDMNVYEGRGWSAQPSVTEERYQKKHGQILEIAYIGQLDRETMTEEFFRLQEGLVMYGMKHGYIDETKFLKPR